MFIPGSDCCGKCNCGNKEYSPESKPGKSGSSHNPVELSDEDGDFDDDDFKPMSKVRASPQLVIVHACKLTLSVNRIAVQG